MNERFFNQINYSSSNEDSQSELEALKLTSSDRVVCITGSGARTLDLLTAGPKQIVSVDFNPTQNHLLALKIAGIERLGYQDFLGFLGIHDSKNRIKTLESLLPGLPDSSRDFWKKKTKFVDKGVIYCGTWEKLLRWMSKTTFLRKRKIDGLWNAPDLESQRRFWEQHWTGPFLKNVLRLLANRFLWTKIIREPGAKLIPRDFDVGGYLYDSIQKMAHHSLIRENPYANLLFRGRYTRQCKLPIHLQAEHFEKLKQLTDRVELLTKPIDVLLSDHPKSFDAFSLSDFASYAPPEIYNQIWKQVVHSAAPDARFCERFFLVKVDGQGNQDWSARISRDADLEQRLEQKDHTCLYSFHAGTILPELEVT